ncbi:Transcriptional regulator, IclR family [Variovorax sp. WDL1]|nr:Transcriptional regulator, IclR family [Variovorax sp. WDL1]
MAAVREDDPDFSGTLAKGLMILQAFLRESRPYANSELAELLGLPRPTVSRLCRTLLALGYLDRDERIDRYFIGPAAVALGYPYLASIGLRSQARPAMQALANQVRGAMSIGVAMGLDVVYVETCAYQRGTLAKPDVGALRSVATTAIGRAWLHSLDEPSRTEVLRELKAQRPDEMARCAAAIDESLAMQERRGFAVNFGDAGFGVQGVALCSRIRHGTRYLIFNCAVPGTQVRAEELVDTLGPRLVDLVRRCERTAGIA